ncbi:hypothetical protein JCM17039_17440 [Blautia glucerasea]
MAYFQYFFMSSMNLLNIKSAPILKKDIINYDPFSINIVEKGLNLPYHTLGNAG